MLAYVELNGSDFNAFLVLFGYARVYVEGNSSRETEYLELEADAKRTGVGLWECARVPSGTETSTPRPTVTPVPVDERTNCDPAYPTVCIPPRPPDLDWGEIPHRNFSVLPPDPHRFDGDKDGIGCEA